MVANAPILEVENLHRTFGGTVALSGINLALAKPGVYGFLGPNGAGKTTTFKLITALLRPTSGRVLIDGIDVQENPRTAAAKVGVLFDSPAFYPYLSGQENLQVISRWLGHEDLSKISDLLSLVGLTDTAHRKVGGYSWGMKQRLGLAAALLSDPQLVLLDEPTNGLDPGGIADIRRLLPKMAHEQGRTVMLSSHRMDEVEQVCDQVTIIHRGRIVADGTPAELAAGDRRIEITCADPDAVGNLLRRDMGITKIERVGGNRLRFVSPNINSGKINRLLIENGMVIEQVVEKRESLEDVFFRLTGMAEHDR